MRPVVFLLAGAVFGSVATYVFVTEPYGRDGEVRPVRAGQALSTLPPLAAPSSPSTVDVASGSFAIDSLERQIKIAAAAPISARRGFELRALLFQLAEGDPQRASRLAQELGLEIAFLIPLFQIWAERDSSAALAEVAALRDSEAMRSVALELLDVFGSDERGLSLVLSRVPVGNAEQFRADAILRLAERDPKVALAWAIESAGDSVSLDILNRLPLDDLQAMTRDIERASPQVREAWTTLTARALSKRDLEGAFAWLSQYIGQPGYQSGVSAIVGQASRDDPRTAVSFLGRLDATTRDALAPVIAHYWAQREPALAAAWVLTLSDASARTKAIAQVASEWTDTNDARNWLLSMPRGAIRDEGLAARLLRDMGREGVIDPIVVNAFSSDAARERAVLTGIGSLFPDEALEAVDTYITDPARRRQAEIRIQDTRQNLEGPLHMPPRASFYSR